ncbi:alpha,alpha-trehalase TreF [Halomonas sp. WWR20]
MSLGYLACLSLASPAAALANATPTAQPDSQEAVASGTIPQTPATSSSPTRQVPPPPDLLWGDLFYDVQTQAIFEDSKTFVDLIPQDTPQAILQAYEQAQLAPGFDEQALRDFVDAHFTSEQAGNQHYTPAPGQDVRAHIDALWPVLTRQPDGKESPYSSRLPLPYSYVVPGGRFNEIYYWDSYFTMLGLIESGRADSVRDMVNNFAYLIDSYGHIPNGNRTYYLTRSQPPFFASMVDLLATLDGNGTYLRLLPELEAEYAYWMDGAESLTAGQAYRRVVKLDDGTLLNRYWDDANTPRQESFREDLATAERSARPKTQVWRDLRAGAESGWDFSSRWLADGETLATIRTTDIAPVDLNSLLYHLEATLAKAHKLAGHTDQAQAYQARADQRRHAIQTLLWNTRTGAFGDYLWREDRLTDSLSTATAYPLFYGIATPQQAAQTAITLERELLKPGGLVTTNRDTGEQWDAPNGWAPQQWLAIKGLRDYGNTRLARMIAERWIATNRSQYQQENKLVEKYNVLAGTRGGGGEYPAQDGFGWTNGVLRKLMALYPQADSASN